MSAPPRGWAVVTGASSGIGVDFARRLAAGGRPVVLVARRRERLESLADELRRAHRVEVDVVAQDLAAPGGAAALADAVRGRDVEVLVNNAGYGIQGRFVEMDPAEVERMIRLNVVALTELTQRFARAMAARGGGFVLNVSSASAFLPTPYVAAYAATKAYVLSFSEALRDELRGSGVSVTALYPGITTTEFNDVAHAKTPAVMGPSILSADAVAAVGLRAMFARRRAAVPGIINRVNAVLSTVLPRGLIVWITGRLLGRANGWP